jgi:hypothetical protein
MTDPAQDSEVVILLIESCSVSLTTDRLAEHLGTRVLPFRLRSTPPPRFCLAGRVEARPAFRVN